MSQIVAYIVSSISVNVIHFRNTFIIHPYIHTHFKKSLETRFLIFLQYWIVVLQYHFRWQDRYIILNIFNSILKKIKLHIPRINIPSLQTLMITRIRHSKFILSLMLKTIGTCLTIAVHFLARGADQNKLGLGGHINIVLCTEDGVALGNIPTRQTVQRNTASTACVVACVILHSGSNELMVSGSRFYIKTVFPCIGIPNINIWIPSYVNDIS